MSPLVSRRKADGFFIGIIIAGLVVLFLLDTFWPEIVLPFGIALSFKQFLRRRKYDMYLSAIIFSGIYLSWKFNIFDIRVEILQFILTLMPILLVVAGSFLIFREYFFLREKSESDEEEELNKEIEEKQNP